MSGVQVREQRRLPWFQVTKAETARLAEAAQPRELPYLRSIYFAVLEIANDHRSDEATVSRAEIAAHAGVSPATVKRLAPELVAAGLVQVDERPGYPSVWTVLGSGLADPGVGSRRPGGAGHVDPGGGSASTGGSGLADPTLKETGQEERNESPTDSLEKVWAHYQAARPNGSRCKLGGAEKRLIRTALKVRDVEECCAAITGLFMSDYHVQNGYIGIKYALRGGGQSPVAGATIDRYVAIARGDVRGHTNGNGRPRGLFADKTFGGRTWDEMTRREQENLKESAMMGREPWDGGRDDPALPTPRREPNSDHGPAWTAANFASDG